MALHVRYLAILAMALVWSSPALSQSQSKEQQDCINTLNKSAAKIGLQQGKENASCLRDAATGKLTAPMTAQACLTADRRGKMLKKTEKVQDLEAEKCGASTPDFAHTGSATVISGAQAGRLLAFADLFTDTVDDALVPCEQNPDICACQEVGADGTDALMKIKATTFLKCKKRALKNGAANPAEIARCITDPTLAGSIAADTKGKIQKVVDKIADKIATECDASGVTLDAFTSHASCSGLEGGALADCIDRTTSCRTCQVLSTVDHLELEDCDVFDNGAADGSCAALALCFPTSTPCDDDNACTVNDTCSAVGCTGTKLVQGGAAAITKQITSIDENDQVHLLVEIVTVTFNPFALTAMDVTAKPGLVLESLGSVCAPHPSNPSRTRCEHTMSFLATSACTGSGTYQLSLNHSCTPAVDGCTLCGDPRTIQFTLATENWCDETTVLTCGNSQIDFGEACDVSNLNGKTCATQGYFGGTLACDATCNFDTSGCQAARVFISSAAYEGNLGGLTGADDKCTTLAAAAALPGTWQAWLSAPGVAARHRLPAVRYRTMSNVVVTGDGSHLYDGSLAANIDRDESNAPVSAMVWTGSIIDGTQSADHCSDWTDTTVLGATGSNAIVSLWSNNGSAMCTSPHRLYCFEALPYKRVFLTSTTYTGNLGGLAGGDAKCQARADAAKLGGTWRAWLSTATTSAADRIPDAEYRLLDLSTVVATNKADLTDGTIAHNIDRDELGVRRSSFVWTGTGNDGVTLGNSCNGWLSQAMNIFLGKNEELDKWSNAGTIGGCSNTLRLYCFEE